MRIQRWTGMVAATATLTLAGCAGGLGVLGDILTAPGPDGQAGTATVEVQEVREATREIIVRTQGGQQGPVLYDENTQVIYQDQRYPVRALEWGDIVDMRIHQVQRGYYTDLIQVRTPAQERQGGTRASPEPNVYRVEGTIGAIDGAQGSFTLQMTQGGTIQVLIPAEQTAARERLRDHLPGDYVRVEVRPIDQERAQLVRFGWS
jgi:translation initiation factor IF-1